MLDHNNTRNEWMEKNEKKEEKRKKEERKKKKTITIYKLKGGHDFV